MRHRMISASRSFTAATARERFGRRAVHSSGRGRANESLPENFRTARRQPQMSGRGIFRRAKGGRSDRHTAEGEGCCANGAPFRLFWYVIRRNVCLVSWIRKFFRRKVCETQSSVGYISEASERVVRQRLQEFIHEKAKIVPKTYVKYFWDER